MKLIKLTDIDGADVYVNPDHVVAVAPHKTIHVKDEKLTVSDEDCEVWVTAERGFRIKGTQADVAEKLAVAVLS